ncbi:MAG: hypothetical protein P8R54_05880 [Myxococcota bacterium]|nr:hypothetical protein [Myxococcota bacterium]
MTYDDLFDGGHFNSPIKSVSFVPTEAHTPIMGNTSIPALTIVLENGLLLRCGRHISYSDWDPTHYTLITHNQIQRTVSEWTEFNNAYGQSPLTWNEGQASDSGLDSLVGKEITAITDAKWRTIIELGDQLFVALENNYDYAKPISYYAKLGVWSNKAKGLANLLFSDLIHK